MRLYHFTSLGHLPHILASALSRGDIPVGQYGEGNYRGAWFTTDPDPSGHGLSSGEMITYRPPNGPPQQLPTVDKRKVRITVIIPSGDEHLYRWLPWTKKRLGQAVIDRLVATGAGKRKAETWYVYARPIAPSRFTSIEFRRPDGSFTTATQEEIAAIVPHDVEYDD